MKKISPEIWMGILALGCVLLLSTKGIGKTMQTSGKVQEKVILVDAGHGGSDPGKIGVNNAKEKDINLAIAKKLKAYLEQNGYQVVMTRETDEGVKGDEGSGSKSADMRNRCAMIEKTDPVIAVSVHQNSYTAESVAGPQVFYYTTSQEGKDIARCIQDVMNEELQIERPRDIKENNTYYILKRSSAPTVIVECGFLSNQAEAQKLITEEYQTEVAESICKGILKYLGGKDNTKQ